MIRYFYLLLVFLSSCTQSRKESDVIRISVLRGPSVIAFAKLIEDTPIIDGKRLSIEMIDSPEQMQAKLIKEEADLAALPMINAANLYNKGLRYYLLGCPVWGNLYIVGKDNRSNTDAKSTTLYIFGAGTTPDILTRYYLQKHGLSHTLNYSFSTPGEITQGLLSGQIRKAVLAEPFLSIALRKDSTLRIESSLNDPDTSSQGFAQTAIIYSSSIKEQRKQIDSLLYQSCLFANQKPEAAIRILEKRNIFAPGTLTAESIQRCRIEYISADKSRESIFRFLRIIEKYESKAIGGKLPDNSFIPENL